MGSKQPDTEPSWALMETSGTVQSESETLGEYVGRGRSKIVQELLPELNDSYGGSFENFPGAWQAWYEDEFLPEYERIYDLIADDPPQLDEEIDDYKRKLEAVIARKFMEKFAYQLLRFAYDNGADRLEIDRMRVKIRELGLPIPTHKGYPYDEKEELSDEEEESVDEGEESSDETKAEDSSDEEMDYPDGEEDSKAEDSSDEKEKPSNEEEELRSSDESSMELSSSDESSIMELSSSDESSISY